MPATAYDHADALGSPLVLFTLQSNVSTAVREAVPTPDVHQNGL